MKTHSGHGALRSNAILFSSHDIGDTCIQPLGDSAALGGAWGKDGALCAGRPGNGASRPHVVPQLPAGAWLPAGGSCVVVQPGLGRTQLARWGWKQAVGARVSGQCHKYMFCSGDTIVFGVRRGRRSRGVSLACTGMRCGGSSRGVTVRGQLRHGRWASHSSVCP